MAGISCFEDIQAWQKARQLSKRIYQITSDGTFAKDFALRDQIRRAIVSVVSNIAEGYERGGDKEFRQFLAVAKGSVGEVKAQLYIALDAGHIQQKEFDELYVLARETGGLLAGFIRYLGTSPYDGIKFRDGFVEDSESAQSRVD